MEMNINSLPISDTNPLGNAITLADTQLTMGKMLCEMPTSNIVENG